MSLIRKLDGTVSNTSVASESVFTDDNNDNIVSTSTLKNNSASVYVDNGFAIDLELNDKSYRPVANKTLTGIIGDINDKIDQIVEQGVTKEEFEEFEKEINETVAEAIDSIKDKADKVNLNQDIYNRTIAARKSATLGDTYIGNFVKTLDGNWVPVEYKDFD